ncbi:BamA/TamA family outer membrane protein [Flavihumibacter profundi]|uniref:BamA/TamA family outer membrane protein n=1 Tax=Flavihumibacter profundi TaxID=2716883 RepID=UPI001CC349DD|nr:BamA/TamA family outer membrane protein [Flavihumibacter profundi]MBZ5858051.1 BamA/TamA family outer membrane protein [Flavihumibacter profundi]
MTCFPAERDMKVNSGHSAKLRAYRQWLLSLIFLATGSIGHAQYFLHVIPIDKDSVFVQQLSISTRFSNKNSCLQYVNQLPRQLAKKGYASASVDSLQVDSTSATVHLFVGDQFYWGQLQVKGLTALEIQQSGIILPRKNHQPFNQQAVDKLESGLISYLSDRGYPFASVQLDSIQLDHGLVNGIVVVTKGIPYKMDSIRVVGSAHITERFLQRYLDLLYGSPYRQKTFESISQRLRELPYLQESKPWAMRFGGNGAELDLFLEPRKSSQVNVLIGLLPTTDQLSGNKVKLTGEANLNLKNALGAGETIGLNWQQLQVQSPRLNLLFQQPFIFGSAFGISAQFDLFKKDSSYLNINTQLGLQYSLTARQTGKVFLHLFRSNLITVDTQQVINSKKLPADIDMSIYGLGADYELFTTNYRRNPRKGWEVFSSFVAGMREIRESSAILNIKDPSFNYASLYDTVDLSSYQFRIKARVARFFPIGRQATLQLLASAAWLQSPQLYRNELFQIGGYKLMRGFDEESIFSSRYLVSTIEYRYLVGMNSYFFAFSDLGLTANKSNYAPGSNRLLGLGFGIAFETAAGFFNLSLAAGKKNDTNLNLRQTKIHLGYVNYF